MQRKPHISLRDLDDREVILAGSYGEEALARCSSTDGQGRPSQEGWSGAEGWGGERAQSELLSHPNLRWQY